MSETYRGRRPAVLRRRVRRRRAGRVATLAALVAALATTAAGPSAGATSAPAEPLGGGAASHLVVLERPAGEFATAAAAADQAREHAAGHDATPTHVYSHAVAGYAAVLTPDQVDALRADEAVAYVEEDVTFALDQAGPAAQVTPTGVRRIGGPGNPNLGIGAPEDRRVDVDIAVIDSGVALHPDLNVVDRVDCRAVVDGACAPGGEPINGHGTHVAGIAAAVNNGSGGVGVAPGARIWSQQACGDSCPYSAVVAAVDNVTAHADRIEVANMSISGPGTHQALAEAITASVDAGVVYVVAAGNSNADAATHTPANHPDVVTVSALADSDGAPGGTGGVPSCRPASQDDRLADFSNWGPAVELAAPGACIRSTWLDGGEAVISGTSMASPHAAGAAALLATGDDKPAGRADVLAVRAALVEAGNLDWFHVDRPGDTVQEPLLDVGDPATFAPDRYVPASAAFTASCNAATRTCTFDGSGSTHPGGPVTGWAWTFGDGEHGSGATVTHTYERAGYYDVTLNVTAAGGTGTRTQRFTVGEPAWRPAAPIPGAPAIAGAGRMGQAQCDDDPDGYYLIAGVTTAGGWTDTVWRYDGAADTWEQRASYPGSAREGIAATCTGDGRIHTMGGAGGPQDHYVYDIHADTWAAATPLPAGTRNAAAGHWEGEVFLFGGGAHDAPTGAVQVYDVATGRWRAGPPLPVARTNAGSAQVGPNLFVVGGWGPDGPVGHTFRLDMEAEAWWLGPTLPAPRSEMALVATDTALYASGGFPEEAAQDNPPILLATDRVERLDLDLGAWPGGAWTTLDPLPDAAGFPGGACFPTAGGAEVSTIGGGAYPTLVRHHWQMGVAGESCAHLPTP